MGYFNYRDDLFPRVRDRIGVVPNRILAAEVGVHPDTIRKWQVKYRIPSLRQRLRERLEEHAPNCRSPSELAELAGCAYPTAWRYLRRTYGRFDGKTGLAGRSREQFARVKDRLGLVEDRVLAEEIGAHSSTVNVWRRRLGIPSVMQRRRGLLAEHASRGVDDPEELSRLAGVSYVTAWRHLALR